MRYIVGEGMRLDTFDFAQCRLVSPYQIRLWRKLLRLSPGTDSSVAHALALAGLPVYVASSQLGSIHSPFVHF